MAQRPEVGYIDTHFHYWDITDYDSSSHNVEWLSDPARAYPRYLSADYRNDLNRVPAPFVHEGSVFVECLPDDPLKEVQWLHKVEDADYMLAAVPYAYLPDSEIDALLKSYSAFPKVHGIRQILNHHPENAGLTWPKVRSPSYLKNDAAFSHGFQLLEKYNFSFELHVNPHQLKDAAAFLHNYPNITIILDHMGCPYLGQGESKDAAMMKLWEEGVKAIAALPQTNVKISGFPFTAKGWETDPVKKEQVHECVKQLLELFTPSRCMVASNFPVDKYMGTEMDVLYSHADLWTSHLSHEDRQLIFNGTARRVYRL